MLFLNGFDFYGTSTQVNSFDQQTVGRFDLVQLHDNQSRTEVRVLHDLEPETWRKENLEFLLLESSKGIHRITASRGNPEESARAKPANKVVLEKRLLGQ